MHLTLSATGVGNDVNLFRVDVNENGEWRYQSRAVEESRGALDKGELIQLKGLYGEVNWSLEVLNNPISAFDGTLFRLEVDHGHGDRRVYQFSEAMTHLSWQFRDLVHFLRHNVAVGGDPIDRTPLDAGGEPPQPHA